MLKADRSPMRGRSLPEGIIATGEFSGAIDAWPEYLRLYRLPGGGIELASMGNAVIGEPGDFGEQDEETGEWALPDEIDDQRVFLQGDLVVSEALVPANDDAVAEFAPGEVEDALQWLRDYGWGGGKDWPRIERAVRAALEPPGSL
ncbi:hypothetical protein J5Y09_18300 [Roseomonas sp. PWR1]|uniref:Uncharacterized protein n=1 Tax=Roseomonas nitratireducens TaxID=2820810 RepID=A0ABS4AXA7_9PROT|nr:hypothetical protein [Neoroseomonas nitratireducens]MBP0465884.1 hypothetical protein [Neoroseomonas nitratireducens]